MDARRRELITRGNDVIKAAQDSVLSDNEAVKAANEFVQWAIDTLKDAHTDRAPELTQVLEGFIELQQKVVLEQTAKLIS